MAEERNLWTATKRESMGVCFVGNVGMREFLSQYITTKPGDIIDKQTGKNVGHHDGAIFYTIGQRHGLDVGGGLPYYVVSKDMDKNEVYVSRNLQDTELVRNQVTLEQLHWIGRTPVSEFNARIRHRGQLLLAHLDGNDLVLSQPERALTPGQSVVVYEGYECLGGGIITATD